MGKSCGGTSIEQTTAIASLAILSALADPAVVNLIRSSEISSEVNTFMSSMRFARREAMRWSDAPEDASPTQ